MITSPKNPRIKSVVRLRDRRGRDRDGQFIIEGYRELTRAVANNWGITELFICRDCFLGPNEDELIARIRDAGAQITETTSDVFRRIAYRDRPEGLLAVAPQTQHSLTDLRPDDFPALLLVAESIEKPGNLGTMLRASDATNVTGLIVCDRCTDLFNPNVVRASIGTLFSVPVATATSEQTIAWLRGYKILILAATPHATEVYTDVDMRRPVAIVVGSEQYGLSEPWLNAADMAVRIPMLGQADSLNVAGAATLLLYESQRQRGFAA